MSYFDYFTQNVVHKNQDVTASCYTMCPKEEIELREKEHLVHVLEIVGQDKKLIKCYTRSAADSKTALPHLLRPFHTLKETLLYLLFEVTLRKDVSVPVLYDFINDRLRSIRQDMTVQRLPHGQCMMLLEPMVRFYVYFGYTLCEYPAKDYDPTLNKKFLLECLKLFLKYSETDTVQRSEDKTLDEITEKIFNMNTDNSEIKLTCDHILMEALYILCNLDDINPLFRYLSLPEYYKCHSILHLAYDIALANCLGNYVQVLRLAERLCPLTYCAFCTYLPTLQRRTLHVMSHAYHSKQLSVPSHNIRELIWCESTAELVEVCGQYGVRVDGDVVRFNKTDFKTDVGLHQPKKRLLRDTKLNLSKDNIFTYRCSK